MSRKKFKYIFCFLFFYLSTFLEVKALDIFYPKNDITIGQNPIQFYWEQAINSSAYNLIVSENTNLSNPVINITVNTNNITIALPNPKTTIYYWRVVDKTYGLSTTINRFNYVILDSLGTISAWYKSDSSVINDGANVSQWNDVSGNEKNLSQANSIYQPNYIAQKEILNNKPIVRFNGNPINYLQTNTDIIFNSYFNIFVLRNYEYYTPAPALQYFLTGVGQGLFSDGIPIGVGVGTFNGNLVSTDISYVKPQYAIYQHTNNTVKINNGLNIGFGSAISSLNLNTLGTRNDALSFAFKGDIAEVLMYKTILTLEQNTVVYNYLADKYAPSINLGPDIIAGSSFCTPVTINAENRFLTYLWNQGQTTSTVSVLPNGKYSVKATDIFGRQSTDEINVYPYARLGNKTIYICQGNSVALDLQTPSNFNVLWNDNSTNKIKTISTGGKYTVKITDAGGCFVYDTINVVVDNPKLNPIVTTGNVTLCKNEKLFLNTATSFDSILWSNGSTDNFIPISTAGTYSVYARTLVGCVLNQSFNVTIAGNAPVAKYDYASLCQNNITQFYDSSTITGGGIVNSWKWDFSNGTSSTQQNPTALFASTGIYSAALKIKTNQGCTDSIFKTFVVNKRPSASFSNRRSCEGNPTTFEDLSSANAASIIARKWDFAGLGIINDIQNPAFVFPTANTYNVKLIVTNSNGCVDSITNSVKVNQSPISDFSFDAVCGKSPVNFKFLASVPTAPNPPQPTIATWQWDFGDNTFNSSIKDVSHVYATTGTYPVKLLVTSSDQCPNTIEKQVKVYEFPNVNFDISPTQCAGKDIQFTDRSVTPDGTPITSWKWYFSGQNTDTMQNTSYAFPTQGNYTVQLTAANAVGCSGTKLRSVAVSSLPIPKFTFSPQNGLPPLIVNYNNQSPITGNYFWDYGDGSPIIQAYNPPTHTYATKGSYPITLTATNFLGCTDTLTKFILVDKAFIDGVMSSVIIIPNGDYYQVQATILNASNIEIRDLGLTLQLGGGAVIKENWSGSLLPGQSTVYNFIGQIKISDNSIPVVCTSIDNVNNNSPEDKVDNNSTCKEVRVGIFDVLNIFPNPAIETVNFGVMLPKDGKVTIGFVDALGQKMYNKEFDGVRGYNNLPMSTVQLNAAIYIAVITYDGETRYQKFMRKDRK